MAGKRTEMYGRQTNRDEQDQTNTITSQGRHVQPEDRGAAWSLQGNGEQICKCGEVGQQEHRRTRKDGRARTPAPFQCRKCRLLGQAL